MPMMKQPGAPRNMPGLPAREIRRTAKQELELARRLRADAEKYHRETAIRARSEAQALILKARLTVEKEIEAITRRVNEEVQKVLADIRVIRITAQEELAAQRKFTDAARLCSMSRDLNESEEAAAPRSRKAHAAVSRKS
jgi:hypothetical protein